MMIVMMVCLEMLVLKMPTVTNEINVKEVSITVVVAVAIAIIMSMEVERQV